MQPYDAKRPCPKCGGSDSTLEYRRDNRLAEDQWYRDHPGEGPIMPGTAVSRALKPEEYLQRRCAACKYPWREACIDSMPMLRITVTGRCVNCGVEMRNEEQRFHYGRLGLLAPFCKACDLLFNPAGTRG